MSILLKNVLLIDEKSTAHNKNCNILIDKGVIQSLNGKKAERVFDLKGKCVTPGWLDLNAHFNDPGIEFKEDITSGSQAAMKGGFTDVQIIPSTEPPIDSKSDVEYIRKNAHSAVTLHVSAALSEGLQGENLTEILDLHNAGAKSFSDGDRPIWNTELLLKALQYTASLEVPIFQNARDRHLSGNSQMHEGIMSTNLGMRGEPSLSEELIIMRDLEILKYSGGKLHFSKISSAKSVDLIKAAKKEGLSVTCDVAIHHLVFSDESIGDFNTYYKSLPPFRTERDRKALIKGLKEGVIDAICSNHRPQDQESKQLEFDLAEPGSISLQTFFPCLLKLSESIKMETLIDKVTNGPRSVLGIEPVRIDDGFPAKLTILNLDKTWVYNASSNESKSTNSPFWEQELKGFVSGTVNDDTISFFE